MPQKFLKKWMPDHDTLKNHKSLKIFGKALLRPSLWHLNRTSTTKAFAVGVFCAFLPIPFQMVVAAFFAIFFAANIPISVALVWLTNPVTIPPVFYFCYKIGTYLLNVEPQWHGIELSWTWVSQQLGAIWQPLWVGSLFCGIIAATLSFLVMNIVWRASIRNQWQKRKLRRASA